MFRELPPVTPALLEDYVNKIILANPERFGGTCYAPVMNEIFKKYVKISSANIPTFVIFITDGANSDKGDASKALINASRYNIFWKFIGIGKERFEFLERLDNLKGRFIDNANFVNVNDLYSISDDGTYLSVVPGSERVFLNGNLLTAGVDYEVNYAGGLLDFKGRRNPGPDDEIRIEYDAYNDGDIYNMYAAHGAYRHPNLYLDV